MMHDFALTAEYVVFMDCRWCQARRCDQGRRRHAYRWSDEYGARLGVMRRDDPFGPVRCSTSILLHLPTSPTPTTTELDRAARGPLPELWRDTDGFDADGALWSWTIELQTGRSRAPARRPSGGVPPHRRPAGHPAGRYAVSVGDGRLVRYDLTTGDAVEHAFGTAQSPGGPGEAVFVPGSGTADESNGWYIAYVYDPARDGSESRHHRRVGLAAQTGCQESSCPHRVPYGFHGNWITG